MKNVIENLSTKAAIIALWVIGVAIVGLVAGTSGAGWITLAAVATLPPVVLLWFWTPPPVTTSERIHRARR
jgi:hypothetical protein